MLMVRILIPVQDNAGNPFSPTQYTEFEARAIHLFGGFTSDPLTSRGGWAGPDGVVYTDSTTGYSIAVESLLGHSAKLHELIDFAKYQFSQHAICVSYLGQVEIL